MSRKLGSKNKPKDIIPETPEPIVKASDPTKKKRHRRTKAEMEAYRALLQSAQGAVNEVQSALEEATEFFSDKEIINKKNSEISSESEDDKLPTQDSERKLKEENNKNINIQELIPKQAKIKSKSKTNVQYPLCDCCQQEIYSSSHRIDTNMFSAQIADYHRVSPRWVNLCSKCALELSSVIDNWLQEHGCIARMEQRMMEKQKEKEN